MRKFTNSRKFHNVFGNFTEIMFFIPGTDCNKIISTGIVMKFSPYIFSLRIQDGGCTVVHPYIPVIIIHS